jgi:hypothetical protein
MNTRISLTVRLAIPGPSEPFELPPRDFSLETDWDSFSFQWDGAYGNLALCWQNPG